MSAFEYSALDNDGGTRKGVIEGDTQRHVRQQLRERGLIPLSLEQVATSRLKRSRTALSASELSVTTRQLASLVSSGLTVEEALQTLARQAGKGSLARVVAGVRAGVREGLGLAESMRSFPRVFSGLYCATVAAGERSGQLGPVLERLADYLEGQQRLRHKVLTALLYPGILFGVAIVVVAGLVGYVLPRVVEVFSQSGESLPALTRGLLSLSAFLRDFGVLALLVVGVGAVGAHLLFRAPWCRFQWQRAMLRVPVLSALIRGLDTTRFSSTLGMLCASGVPMLESLGAAARVIANLPMRSAIEDAARRVREGASLHHSLEASGQLPPVTLQLIATGEASGRLESMLAYAAEHQRKELETRLTTLLGLFEPLLILLMGALVFVIVLAILLPIFELPELVH